MANKEYSAEFKTETVKRMGTTGEPVYNAPICQDNFPCETSYRTKSAKEIKEIIKGMFARLSNITIDFS